MNIIIYKIYKRGSSLSNVSRGLVRLFVRELVKFKTASRSQKKDKVKTIARQGCGYDNYMIKVINHRKRIVKLRALR